MAVTTPSPLRDRTPEFLSLSNNLRRIGINSLTPSQLQLSQENVIFPNRSEFNKAAKKIRSRIDQTSQKVDRLSKMSKRSSIFDDHSRENNELSALIKNDITALDSAVSDLQTLQRIEIADGNYSGDRVDHLTTVCADLTSKLKDATKLFQDVLETKSKNIKAHEDRKQLYSTAISREEPLARAPKSVVEPAPWSTSSDASGGHPQSSVSMGMGVPPGNQLRRRMATDIYPSSEMEVSMLQQVVPRQESISQSRVAALQNVNSTISELGGIFSHLATMVSQQGELAIRIDDNMDESVANVEGAHNSLLKYFNQMRSNRWLMIKFFLILIFFLVVFIVFVL